MGTTEATLRVENVDVKEEWQDEALPRCWIRANITSTASSNSLAGYNCASPASFNFKECTPQEMTPKS
ncbi:hypothetical protein MC885_008616 [Smutsia gigantea]|nr:hypothetical protein MC885_008616 [Smutsia gigantea]